jgi:medium-chain acyl-[acyl-carrier-protein] hydrolase
VTGGAALRPLPETIRRWWPPLREVGDPAIRLFCFPYAGASAVAFASWPVWLHGVDVRPLQLPGRASRLRDAPFTRIADLVETVAPALRPLLDRPFALFGHSMGALAAFEMARYLQRHAWSMPARLYVSGRRAPQFPDLDLVPADASDDALLATLRSLEGTPSEVLDSPELMDLLMPTLRADFEMVRSYVLSPGAPLTCPITVLGGIEDEESADGYLDGWRQHTIEETVVMTFSGGHFFLHTEPAVLSTLAASLDRMRAPFSASSAR